MVPGDGAGAGIRGTLGCRLVQRRVHCRALTRYRVTVVELASRLSFFLWSSIPDEPLLEAAEKGRLKNSAVMAQHVRRMLADPRADRLIENFAGQWLLLRNLEAHRPDLPLFPSYDDSLRVAARAPTLRP